MLLLLLLPGYDVSQSVQLHCCSMTSLLAHAVSVGKPLTDQLQTLVRRSRIVVIITAPARRHELSVITDVTSALFDCTATSDIKRFSGHFDEQLVLSAARFVKIKPIYESK